MHTKYEAENGGVRVNVLLLDILLCTPENLNLSVYSNIL